MSDLSLDNLLIFEKSVSGRVGYSLPTENIDIDLDDKYLRKASLDMPELSELDVVRHYTNLSLKNFGVDQGFYPLGSLTLTYLLAPSSTILRTTSSVFSRLTSP